MAPGHAIDDALRLSRNVGVILFANTSTSGEEARSCVNIFQALWKHAEAMKAPGDNTSRP
jgi:hypothetical protein